MTSDDSASEEPRSGDEVDVGLEQAAAPSSARLLGFIEIAVVVLVAFVSVRVHMEAFPEISPFDEATHIDYVLTLGDLAVPELGVPYHETVLREWSCRGSYSEAVVLPACDSASFDFSDYPGRGVQRNETPPLYYLVTAAITRPIASFTDQSDVGLARLAGSLFLAVGMLGMIHAARQLGASRWPTLIIASSIPLAVPTVLHATATVNSDALVFGFGGVAIAVAVAISRGVAPVWSLLVLAVIGGLSKQTGLFPVIAASVIVLGGLLWTEVEGERSRPGRRVTPIAIALAAPVLCLFVLAVWAQIVDLWTPADYTSPINGGNSREIKGGPFDEIFGSPLNLMPPTKLNFIPIQIRTRWHAPWAKVLDVVILTAFGAAITHRLGAVRSLGLSLLASSVATVVVIQSVLVLTRGTAFPEVSPRYAVGLVPLAMCVVCVALRNRWLAWATAVSLAVGSAAVSWSSLVA